MAFVFQHLLLATEHTEFDSGAEQLAMAMAGRCSLPLDGVLPMVSNPEFEAVAPELATRADLQAAERIADLHKTAQAKGVYLAMHARRGPEPYREVVDEAQERGSDLLVIRRRGQRSFLAKLLLGEMVTKVVAHAPCHVLVVPREARMWSQRVLVAAEPGALGERLVQLASEVAAECSLPLSVLSVSDGAPATREAAEAFVRAALTRAQQAGVRADGEVLTGKPADVIVQAARNAGADLLVMGSRGDTAHAHPWVGGVVRKAIALTATPVLLANFHSEEKKTT